ncbi:MAG: DUF1232 domain-containing protein [Treponemataceae bacterium]|nr:DUF1232 domain-containing protein [Treponemataceae bacterium]
MKKKPLEFEKEKALEKAEKFGEDATEQQISEVKNKIDKFIKGPMKKVGDKMKRLWQFYLSPDTPKWMKVEIIGALIYVISPIDLIPDAIPFIGFLDDIFVIGAIFHSLINAGVMIMERDALPAILDFGEKEIKGRLNASLKVTIKNTVITFFLLMCGILFVVFKPINQTAAYYIASVFFLFSLVWSCIRFVKNARITYPIIKNIIQEANVESGICKYLMERYPKVKKALDTVKKLSPYIPALKDFPELEEIVRYYIDVFKKRIIIFISMFGAYTILFFITRRILITQFGGISTFAAYFYPIIHIWKTVAALLK